MQLGRHTHINNGFVFFFLGWKGLYQVKNNTQLWRNWVVNIPPAPLPYVTFWSNATIIALFFTAVAWPVGMVLLVYRKDVHPLVLVPRNDLALGMFCPLFAMFIPIGIQITWRSGLER